MIFLNLAYTNLNIYIYISLYLYVIIKMGVNNNKIYNGLVISAKIQITTMAYTLY